jgi:hypothetical protein
MVQAESPEAKEAAYLEVEEATAKLAEVEILGRHMARSFHDESEKIAMTIGEGSVGTTLKGLKTDAGDLYQRAKGLSGKQKAMGAGGALLAAGGAVAAKKGYDKYKEKKASADEVGAAIAIFEELGLDVDIDLIDHMYSAKEASVAGGAGYLIGGAENKLKGLTGKQKAGLAAAGALGTGAAAFGAKKLNDRRKAKTASAFDKLATDRANEILESNGFSGSDESDIEQLVNARAIEMLESAGYTFEE